MDGKIRSQSPRVRKTGFTFTEVVVALAIIAVLSAVIVPGLIPKLSGAQAATLSQDIKNIATGIQQFRENVGRYPQSIDYLVTIPTTAKDLCGFSIPLSNRQQWKGPYISVTPTANGIASGDSYITTPITRTLVGSSYVASFEITQVDSSAAEVIENNFDGFSNLNSKWQSGTITWFSTSGQGFGKTGTLKYTLPLPLNAC